jgi:cytochrome c oxidase cbb3-type subunit 3
LTLMRRMLYPGSEGRGSAPLPARPTATVVTDAGERFEGALAYRDEFTIALTDAGGRYRSWPVSQVAVEVRDPLAAHVDQLAVYSDDDIHDVYAYLETLTEERDDE